MIISTIIAILAPIVYLLPFIVKWVKGEEIYQIPKTKKIIPNKWVFVAKMIFLVILAVIFYFVFPSKVMFYPLKTGIFILILILATIITGPIFCQSWLNKDISNQEIFKQIAIYWIILIIFAIVALCAWGNEDKSIVCLPEKAETVNYEVKSINSSGIIFYYDDNSNLQTLSILDKNVHCEPLSDEKKGIYIEFVSKYEQYQDKYDKDETVFTGKQTSEEYIVYIPNNELNELMKK